MTDEIFVDPVINRISETVRNMGKGMTTQSATQVADDGSSCNMATREVIPVEAATKPQTPTGIKEFIGKMKVATGSRP